MNELAELVRQYGELLDKERVLGERKEALRQQILDLLDSSGLKAASTPFGNAKRCSRFKLTPHRDEVLSLLASDDLFPFAPFSPARVKDVLVPKYGRERLLPLFEIEKSEYLMIQRGKPPKPYG